MSYVFYFGLIAVLVLRKFKVPGSVLISIIFASVFAHFLGLGEVKEPIKISAEMFGAIFKLDLGVIFNLRILSVILVLFLIDFYGSIAKFIGLTRRTSIVDKNGEMPRMKEAMLVDGTANSVGAVLGTTSIITYVESAVGIAEGGRTGFTAVVAAILMFAFILLTPIVNLVPLIATTGALFWVGIALFPHREDLKTYTKLDIISVLLMIVAVIVTFAIDKALLIGFAIFILGLIISGRFKEINPYMVLSTILLLIGWIFSVILK